MLQRSLGPGEIDQYVRTLQGIEVRRYRHPAGSAGALAGILIEHRAVGPVQCRRQHAIRGGGHGLDQHLAHAATGAGNGDTV